ncbi:fumarylacetoacetate hydrolase family protein [Streptomyces sp. NPDC050619]|uniref:fumarylacetoacetate hydrolase family protein n=1 Tax=Streptomyces sp. NPDC050619 TaxID=3157214 RepID=UPI00342D9941
MKFVSFETANGSRGVGVLTEEGIRVLLLDDRREPGTSPMRRLLQDAGGRLTELRDRVDGAPVLAVTDVRIDAPVPDPSKIVAAPVNYRDHQAEMRQETHVDTLGVFLKSPSSLVPYGGVVQLPYRDRRFDQEGELALVVGREMSDIPPEKTLDYVAGYTCLLDMTMRGGEDRSIRKSFDTFTPLGPYLVTPDEVGPLEALELRCSVDGTPRQHARIADLIWDVPRLLSYISSTMRLLPGDVISTGTPAGVGEVRDGQRIVVEIDRVGRLDVSVSSTGAVASPTRGHKVPHAVAAASAS